MPTAAAGHPESVAVTLSGSPVRPPPPNFAVNPDSALNHQRLPFLRNSGPFGAVRRVGMSGG
jgi:hypothetical protein